MSSNEIDLSTQTRESLDRNNLRPLWEIAETDLGQRQADLEANLWRWEDIRSTVDHVASDVPQDMSPRVTVPVNSTYSTALSHTISVGVEAVPPGHTTPSHRHSGHFLRFGIDGNDGMKTTVGGEDFPTKDNDLVTIPQWEWHGHSNESDEEAVWLVVDDSPLLIEALNLGTKFEWSDEESTDPTRPEGYHESRYGNCRPQMLDGSASGPFQGDNEPTPPYRFAWTDVSGSLDQAATNSASRSPYDGFVVSYTNPAEGSEPLFPTLGVRAQRLVDGARTETHRHNSTEIYFVLEGNGRTEIEGETVDWSERDIFVVPPQEAHFHEPEDDSTVLTITDRPLLEAINSYTESNCKMPDGN